MGLVRATPDAFETVSTFSVPGAGSDSKVWTHPAIADGRLYIRRQDDLFAYDIKAK